MKIKPKVSFIIPVMHLKRPLNKQRFFMPRSTIKDIIQDISSNVTLDYEIVVICNSTDEELRSYVVNNPNINKYALNSVNIGVPRSWNMGAQLSEGELLCYVSDDVRVGKDAIEKLCAVLDSELEVAEVGPRGDNYLDGNPNGYVGINTPEYADVISGFLFIVRSRAFHEVGGFDISYSPAGCEEVDFSFALRKKGWKCKVIPKLDITHNEYHGVSAHRTNIEFLGETIDTLDLHQRNRKHFLKKWGYL